MSLSPIKSCLRLFSKEQILILHGVKYRIRLSKEKWPCTVTVRWFYQATSNDKPWTCVSAWFLGWFMCKAVAYIQGVSVAASVYSLVAVSLDRYVTRTLNFSKNYFTGVGRQSPGTRNRAHYRETCQHYRRASHFSNFTVFLQLHQL